MISVSSDTRKPRKGATHILAISPLLAIKLQIPSQSSLKELLVLCIRQIQLLVHVALPIWGDVHDGLDFQTTEDQSARDNVVVALAENTDGGEEIFTGSFETIEEAGDLVGGHECESELLIVLEIDAPDREASRVKAEKNISR
jgi:hypothetical protein